MADATICIPWRPQPARMAAHDRVIAFWTHFGFPVIEADSDPDLPFSLTEARNNAVHQADTQWVIVADADCIPDIANILAAFTTPDTVTWPYTKFLHIDATWADQSDLIAAPIDQTYTNSCGGVFVCRRDLYWQLGGMDDRCDRIWGWEDRMFYLAAQTLAAVRNIPGLLWSFNHDAERPMHSQNRCRYSLYQYASGKPEVMRELIKR